MANEMNKEITQETTEQQELPVEVKKGIIEKFKELPTWQKALVIAACAGMVVGGGALIFKIFKQKPEAVADAIEVVTNDPEVIEAVGETIAA